MSYTTASLCIEENRDKTGSDDMVLRWSGHGGRSGGRLRLPGGAVFDRPVNLSRLMARYVLTGLIALVIIAVFTAWASRSLGTKAAIDSANRRATLTAHAAVEPTLDDGILHGDPASMKKIDGIVRSQVLRGTLIRVKIWDTDGTILYSDENRLIGRKFELQQDELTALQTGETEAGLSDLSEPENQYEEPATELLEVYLPVTPSRATSCCSRRTSGTPGSPRPAASSGCSSRRSAWARWCCSSCCRCRWCSRWPAGCAAPNTSARTCSATRWRRPRRSAAGSPVTCTTASYRTWPGWRSRSAPPPASANRDPEDAAAVRAAADQVRDGVRSLRSLMVEIYPPNLYDEGLEAALSDLLARLEPRGIETSLRVDAPLDTLDMDAVQLLYRAAQEGVRNVVAHADASRVSIAVYAERGSVVLEVSDDGRGLPGPDLPQKPGHLGLRALGGLAATMGASLTLSSTPGKGTVLALEMPTP